MAAGLLHPNSELSCSAGGLILLKISSTMDGTLPEFIFTCRRKTFTSTLIGFVGTAAAASLMEHKPKAGNLSMRSGKAKLEPYSDGYFDPYYDGLFVPVQPYALEREL